MACAAPLLMAWAWDASRAAPSWWVLGAQAYGTLGSLSADLITWARLLLIGLGPVFALGGFLRWQEMGHWADRERTIQLALALTLLLWLPIHILLGFQPWERYLLPLVPVAALLLTANDTSYPFFPDFAGQVSLNPCSISLLLIPALIVPFGLEPHDGRWEGIAEIGATIEELPPQAIVYYLDVGRPLAWYAADAEAKLQWVGSASGRVGEWASGRNEAALPAETLVQRSRKTFTRIEKGWQRLPELLTESQSSPHYVILRRTVPLPSEVAHWTLIKENRGFRLLAEDN